MYRQAFLGVDGVATLVSVLSGRVNFQIQYQVTPPRLWMIDAIHSSTADFLSLGDQLQCPARHQVEQVRIYLTAFSEHAAQGTE